MKIATTASTVTSIRVTGGRFAFAFLWMAERCGLEIEVESVTFTEPIQAVADRLAVEALIRE